ncbi:MAG: MBL fold metallo-hydrolase [Candidatus Hydrogenedens sp.]
MSFNSIKLAGVCVVWRKNKRDIEVLVIKRGETLSFLPGHHAFPGGSIEEEDKKCEVFGSNSEKIKSALVGAIRETFEETGYLPIQIKKNISNEELNEIWERFHHREINFVEVQKKFNLKLNLDEYFFSGPWITPPGLPQRFETYFFFIEWKPEYYVIEGKKNEEVDLIEWDTPQNILYRWHKQEISISTPVAFILEQIEAFSFPNAYQYLKKIPWKDNGYSYFHPRAGVHIFPLPAPPQTFFKNVNSIVIGKKEMIIIDPGEGKEESIEEMIYWLEHFIRTGSKYVGVCITHEHSDHAKGIDIISKHFDIPKYASFESAQRGNIPIDKTIGDGQQFVLNDRDFPWIINIISTPGHVKGHLCYYETTTQTLIAGDMISSEGPVVIDPDEEGSMSEYMDSLNKLNQLKIDLLIPGHGVPWFNMSGNLIIDILTQHRKQREEKILQNINSGITSFEELLIKSYDDIPQERLILARQQLKAHLIDFQQRGLLNKEIFY